MSKILNGKKASEEVLNWVKKEVEMLGKSGIVPGLAIILVGEDPASIVYTNIKEKRCKEVGIYIEKHKLPEHSKRREIISLIEELNQDKRIHGIIVQLPLPGHLNENDLLMRILPKKDVDGLNPLNMGTLLRGNGNMVPCTPQGIIYLLDKYKIDVAGKKAVVVGRSNIVGKPVSLLLLQKNATVTICHSKTKNLSEETRRADILIVAVGKPKFISEKMVKKGAVVIDVGVNRVKGKLVGDVDFENVKRRASFITPVPGGVGPMTVAMLLKNTILACKGVEK